MKDRDSYQISRWERLFGGDMWFLRNVGRVLLLVVFAKIPIEKWRHAQLLPRGAIVSLALAMVNLISIQRKSF